MEDFKQKKLLLAVTLGEIGGAQKYVQDIALGLKDDYKITVSCGEKDAPLIMWAQKEGFATISLLSSNRTLWKGFLPTINDFKTFARLYRIFKAKNYDIIHLNSSKMGFLGALAGKLAHIPKVVFTAHGWVFNEPKSIQTKKWLWLAISKISAYFQDKIICVSNYDLDMARKYHMAPARKLVAIYNGIDTNNISFLSRQKSREWLSTKINIQEDTVILGTIANLYKTKDLKTMIKAVNALKNINIILVIFGEGPEREILEEEIKKQKLESRVFLLGKTEKAHRYLKALDVYIISSVKEGLPYSALEAMTAKIPIISTGAGGLREIFFSDPKKPSALSFKMGNTKDLAEKIEYILANKEDADIIVKNASYILRKEFELDKMISKTRWVYDL